MSDFPVSLNKCVGDVFENDITCDRCKEKGTIVLLFGHRICKWCLRKAEVAINRAVMDSCGLERPYE
jgi:hypothetical protein